MGQDGDGEGCLPEGVSLLCSEYLHKCLIVEYTGLVDGTFISAVLKPKRALLSHHSYVFSTKVAWQN